MRIRTSSVVAATVVATLLLTVAPSAQTPSRTFDVASVKKRESTQFTMEEVRAIRTGGLYRVAGQTVAMLIEFAYRLHPKQIVGGPEWIWRDMFDVTARTGESVTSDEMRVMVQSLLSDRFRLTARIEKRPVPHYELKLARPDGQMGPNIERIDAFCNEARARRPPAPAGAMQSGGCGPMSALARLVSLPLDALVLDQTGLSGTFSFIMYVSPDDASRFRLNLAPGAAAAADPGLPSFETALREQLGLRLESTRDPVDVFVIDSIQPPLAD